jgi:branched-chain amino acid transport system permease protein
VTVSTAKARARATAGRLWSLALLWLIVTVIALLLGSGPPDLRQTVVTALVNLIVVVGVYAFIGLSGVMSFGHLAFMAVGAYTAGLVRIPASVKEVLLPDLPGLLAHAQLGVVPSVLLGGVAAALLAAVLAFPLMRMSGLSAGIASFAVLLVVNVVARNWDAVTGGSAGMNAVPVTTTPTSALLWALAAIAAVYVFQRSSWGVRLRASREDEIAARGSGVDIVRERSVGFVLSAFVVGVGGALYGQLLGAFTPDAFYLTTTFLVMAMLIVGGVRSLTGAVVGVIFISAVAEALNRLQNGEHLGPLSVPARPGTAAVGLALILLVTLVVRPEGIVGARELRWPLGPVPPGDAGPDPATEDGSTCAAVQQTDISKA